MLLVPEFSRESEKNGTLQIAFTSLTFHVFLLHEKSNHMFIIPAKDKDCANFKNILVNFFF